MAGITDIAGINVVLIFTTGRCPIMASNAIINEIAMIHRSDRCPRIDSMTIITG